jgi:hypothetical protein
VNGINWAHILKGNKERHSKHLEKVSRQSSSKKWWAETKGGMNEKEKSLFS